MQRWAPASGARSRNELMSSPRLGFALFCLLLVFENLTSFLAKRLSGCGCPSRGETLDGVGRRLREPDEVGKLFRILVRKLGKTKQPGPIVHLRQWPSPLDLRDAYECKFRRFAGHGQRPLASDVPFDVRLRLSFTTFPGPWIKGAAGLHSLAAPPSQAIALRVSRHDFARDHRLAAERGPRLHHRSPLRQ